MSHRSPEPREALGLRRLPEDRLRFLQDGVVPGLSSFQVMPHVALIGRRHARHAEGHANIAMWRALATAHTRRPEALLRRGPVEPKDVDADT